jgi:hypothetical protein
MELVLGIAGEVLPGPYVDSPEEGCAYTLVDGLLMRHRRGGDLVLEARPLALDPEAESPAHERPRLHRIERMLRESAATARLASPFVVFVPREGDLSTGGILAGSGIVGAPLPGAERVAVYYEGARHAQVGMARLADRVLHAYGRLRAGYPTTARMAAPRGSLVEVATFDPACAAITTIDAASEAALAGWLGAEELDPAELVPTPRNLSAAAAARRAGRPTDHERGGGDEDHD